MKFSSLITVFSISLCASLCCPEEDNFDAPIRVENNNLIKIENNENAFSLNDNIVIETQIANNQTSEIDGDIILTDLFYDDTLETSFLQHTITLYKLTGFETLSEISILNDDITTEIGTVETNSQYITIRSFYDESTNSFRSKFAINLKESGTFFLSDTRFGINDYIGIRISGGVYELGFIEILTSIENANTEGGYEFQVTE